MSSSTNIQSGDGRRSPEVVDFISNTYPLEVFDNVLSYLGTVDIQVASFVKRSWKKAAIATTKNKEFILIKKFVSIACNNLNSEKYSSQINYFKSLLNNKGIFGSKNLIEIKNSILSLKDQIAFNLKQLDELDLNNLKNQTTKKDKPTFFDDIFELADIYRRVFIILEPPRTFEWEEDLRTFSDELTQRGNIDKALAVAEKLSEIERSHVIWGCAKGLACTGNIKRAMELINRVHNEEIKGSILKELPEILLQNEDMRYVIDHISSIQDEQIKGSVLRTLAKCLVHIDHVVRALHITNTIDDQSIRESVFCSMSKSLVNVNDLEGAFEVAKLIQDKEKKTSLLTDISHAWTRIGNVERAREVAHMIPNELYKAFALTFTLNALTEENGSVD